MHSRAGDSTLFSFYPRYFFIPFLRLFLTSQAAPFALFPDNLALIALCFISCGTDNSFFLSSSRSAVLAFPLRRHFSAGRHKLN